MSESNKDLINLKLAIAKTKETILKTKSLVEELSHLIPYPIPKHFVNVNQKTFSLIIESINCYSEIISDCIVFKNKKNLVFGILKNNKEFWIAPSVTPE